MELRNYPRLGEKAIWQVLPNGLTVVVLPREGFSKKVAYFAAGCGSQHRNFIMDGKTYTAPMGVAHFLEHKLFDMPGRDISAEFAQLGAMVNAFTSYDMTAYYFSCTENFAQCLQLLIEFVSKPYFTQESVDKEQGIIGQEIDMNADAPETVVFESLAEAMYENHPVKEPILGTRQTIAQITPQVLYDCHKAYYRPENMLLCVVSDESPEQVIAMAERLTKDLPCPQVQILPSAEEPDGVKTAQVCNRMEVARPMFQLGFKCDPLGDGEEGVYWEYVGDLAAEALFGESSPLYLRLYEEGLIDPSFGGGLDTLPGMAMLTASGDSDDPQAVRDAILAQAKQLVETGIPQADFLRMKRSTLGGKIRGLDSFDSTCFRVCSYHFSRFDYLRFPEIYEKIKAEDVRQFIARFVTPQRCGLSVVAPKEETNAEQ